MPINGMQSPNSTWFNGNSGAMSTGSNRLFAAHRAEMPEAASIRARIRARVRFRGAPVLP